MRTAASNISVQAPHGKQRDTIGILRRGLPPDTSLKSAYHGSRRRLLLDYAFPFFYFLLRACHNIVEGDVINPRILLQIDLGRPLSPGRFAEGSGWADGIPIAARLISQSHGLFSRELIVSHSVAA